MEDDASEALREAQRIFSLGSRGDKLEALKAGLASLALRQLDVSLSTGGQEASTTRAASLAVLAAIATETPEYTAQYVGSAAEGGIRVIVASLRQAHASGSDVLLSLVLLEAVITSDPRLGPEAMSQGLIEALLVILPTPHGLVGRPTEKSRFLFVTHYATLIPFLEPFHPLTTASI